MNEDGAAGVAALGLVQVLLLRGWVLSKHQASKASTSIPQKARQAHAESTRQTTRLHSAQPSQQAASSCSTASSTWYLIQGSWRIVSSLRQSRVGIVLCLNPRFDVSAWCGERKSVGNKKDIHRNRTKIKLCYYRKTNCTARSSA
jgi:hypothetical protein